MPRLLLVDGSSYLYRAYHALPDLRSDAGEPTGAIRGFISMMKKLREDYHADYIACVFDAKGKTFRDEQYPEYKAQRAPMPEDLARQIEPIHEGTRALGWPILMVEGVEADDVIGTLARIATEHKIDTIISTGDKDMAQLVNEHVSLVNTMSNEKLDIAGVTEKFGVPPELIIDYLTLMGDAVDNVPGIEKVGPKTAVKMIKEYGSLQGVLDNADKVKGVVGENLRKVLDWLPKARELLTIKCDVPELHPEILAPMAEDKEALLALYKRYSFKSWLREIEGASGGPVQATPSAGVPASDPVPGEPQDDLPSDQPKEYETVRTMDQLDAWIARLNAVEIAAVDTETTALDPMLAKLVGISLSVEPYKGAYIPLRHVGPDAEDQLPFDETLEKLRPWLESHEKKKVGQHLKYDAHIFANHGVSLNGIAHDTLLQSYVLESHKSHNMDSLAERHLGRKTIKYEEVCGKGAGQICFDQVAIDKATEYSAEDSEVTLQLHQTLWPRVEKDAKLKFIYELEIPVSGVLLKMERNGVLIDAALLEKQGGELGNKMLELEQKAYELAGQPFNLGSPKQIGEIFFERMKLPVIKKTPSGAPSTDEEVLQKLAEDYPLPKILLDYRSVSKLKSTYTDKLPRMVNPNTGRVHTSYAQAVAVTGRLSSNDPNLQNIPIRTAEGRRIREAFIAPPGSLIISADYSQIELRIMAHISKDPALIAAFTAGEDVHRTTASEVFGAPKEEVTSEQRRYAKVINFGLIYGMSAFGLASNLGIERDAAKNYIDRYFERFAGVKRYMDETRIMAKEKGYVETVFGRRLWLPDINGGNGPRRQGAERQAINAPMQGTAADLIKMSMIAVQDWIEKEKLGTRMIMQVHDELVLEVPEGELELAKAKVPELMSKVAALDVPLVAEVGVGPNWDKAH
jgi:DNA polymerase-1